MKNNIYKKDGNLVIEISLKEKRWNPYDSMADENYQGGEEMDSIVGIIMGDEIGFAHWIDRSYKGKSDDVSTLFYNYWEGDEKEFVALCKKLEIEIIEYPQCGTCGKSILGCMTIKNGKPICFDCENKTKKTESQIENNIKELLRGAITTQNIINEGVLNEVGINYMADNLTKRILEIFIKENNQI